MNIEILLSQPSHVIQVQDSGIIVSSRRSTAVQRSSDFSRKEIVPVVNEVLRENVPCTLLLDLEHFNSCTLRFSSDSPYSVADDGLLEEVKELICEVDADIAIPFVGALLLDSGWDLLRAYFVNVQQSSVA